MAKKATTKKSTTRAPRKATAPADETKAQKFSRLATKRVNAAVAKIRQIGNLSGAGYEKTEEQIALINTALTDAVSQTMAKFGPKEARQAAEQIRI